MKSILSGLFAVVVFALSPSASAALISPVSATTTIGNGYGTSLINTINGVGLSSLNLTALHAATTPENSWVSRDGVLTGDITFDLGGTYSVQGFSFWNQNGGGPDPAGGNGIQNLVISSSLDNILFTPIAGAPVGFARETGLESTAQQFSFAAVNARHVKFSVASNYGNIGNTGFAEIQFDNKAASVPDSGSTLTLLGCVLLGFAALQRPRSATR